MADNEFKDLLVPELKAVAETFAVDLDGITKKQDIINELDEMGVTWEMYQASLEPEDDFEETVEESPAPVVTESKEPAEEEADSVVVKMTRKNWTYEIRGYRFTQQHPYALVAEDDADYLIETDGGFRMASPKELREFYGS